MIFESLEDAQREASFLKTKMCSDVKCSDCRLPERSNCEKLCMDNPLFVIEAITGEKCSIKTDISMMRQTLDTFCASQSNCISCRFNDLKFMELCVIANNPAASNTMIKVLYDYYKDLEVDYDE